MYATEGDKTLTCIDCSQQFAFTASEQQFYADRQFSEPRRCPSCRAIRKAQRGSGGASAGGTNGGGNSYGGGYSSGGGGSYGGSSYAGNSYAGSDRGYDRGPREMFSATCASCGREAQVPFRPNGTKPVYCSDCFRSR
jgi:CxxC-x17-CxxC domain-containing protein